MNEEYNEKPKKGLTLALVLVVLVGLVIWLIPQVKMESKTDEESIVDATNTEEKSLLLKHNGMLLIQNSSNYVLK